jgi:hypothetical protein
LYFALSTKNKILPQCLNESFRFFGSAATQNVNRFQNGLNGKLFMNFGFDFKYILVVITIMNLYQFGTDGLDTPKKLTEEE